MKGLQKFWKEWTNRDTIKSVYFPIPTEQTDTAQKPGPLRYFRVWMSEMYLAKDRKWFVDIYPAFQVTINVQLRNKTVSFSQVINAPKQAVHQGVNLNHSLTPILPYEEGLVEINACLLGFPARNYIASAVAILNNFSGLVTPPIGQALKVAEKISNSMGNIVASEKGKVYLPFQQTFASQKSDNPLTPGYYTAIGLENVNHSTLRVEKGQLYQGRKQFSGGDYILLRIEGNRERDWSLIPSISDPYQKAYRYFKMGDTKTGKVYRNAALAAVLESDELVLTDIDRVFKSIDHKLAAARQPGHGAEDEEIPSLDEGKALIPIRERRELENLDLEMLLPSGE